MIKSFRHKGLRELFETGKSKHVGADFQRRAKRILDILSRANEPEACDIPGFLFHPLKGDRRGTYAMKVSGNFRIAFEWDAGATDVDLEDYHKD